MWTLNMSLDDYRRFLHDMMNLQMEYVYRTAQNAGFTFAQAVNRLTGAYAYSIYFDPTVSAENNPAWKPIVERLDHLAKEINVDRFIVRSWDILEPILEPRMDADLKKAQAAIAASFAGFSYEFHGEYFGPETPALVTLHFRNFFAPDSPFSHRSALIDGLRRLVADAKAKCPDVSRVQCASWLNNVEPFYRLFPPSWYENSVVCPLEGHTGWWGQLIDRQGQLHPKKVEAFRKTWTFEYPNRMCTCDLAELERRVS